MFLFAAACAVTGSAYAQLRAFPEAEGFGAYATGGRGGTVYHVTNLNDSGPGSFRDAVSASGRIVVFDVGGWINLASPVSVKSNITIAGQTAPGDGIGLKNYELSFSNASNVVARYLRVRQGLNGDSIGHDSITVDSGSNLMFDHISDSWGRDEVFSINNSSNITLQNSIVAEGLLAHSMGGLIQNNTISLHHDLYINNNDRNPKVKGSTDFVNNVVYDWGEFSYIAGDSAGVSETNIVNNYFIAGPSTTDLTDPIVRGNSNAHVYFAGNMWDGNQNGVLDGNPLSPGDVTDDLTYFPTPFPYPQIRTDSAQDAYAKVVANVGDSIVRDSTDTRLINDLVTQTGRTISDPAQVGGYGTLASGVAPLDTDQDGIPDAWEISHGLNPNDPSDRNDLDVLGYTRLEEYLNQMPGIHAARIWSAASGDWNGANWPRRCRFWMTTHLCRAAARGRMVW